MPLGGSFDTDYDITAKEHELRGGLVRKKVPKKVVIEVLTEARYRCAVQTCRNIFAIDIHHWGAPHHIIEVVEGGDNELANLIALCLTCHALFHRGIISRDSIL